MTTDILTHVEAGVMTITLNRLERKNSITGAMYGAMADGLAAAQEDAAVRVRSSRPGPTSSSPMSFAATAAASAKPSACGQCDTSA